MFPCGGKPRSSSVWNVGCCEASLSTILAPRPFPCFMMPSRQCLRVSEAATVDPQDARFAAGPAEHTTTRNEAPWLVAGSCLRLHCVLSFVGLILTAHSILPFSAQHRIPTG
ncbi:hypothetical protein BJX99DRAFT_126410 [Aspergillus californicus]